MSGIKNSTNKAFTFSRDHLAPQQTTHTMAKDNIKKKK